MTRVEHELVDRAGIAEAHLALGRDARSRRRARDRSRGRARRPDGDRGAARRRTLRAIACATTLSRTKRPFTKRNCASREARVNPGGATRPVSRTRGRSRPRTSIASLREIVADEARRAGAQRLGRQMRRAPPVVRERKRHFGPRQRDAREGLVATREFGRLALQELAARGRVEVEILDIDGGAGARAPRARPRRRCPPRTRCVHA